MKNIPAFILFLALSLVTDLVNAQQKKPNILLLVADDLGYTDLGCFGGEIRTPNIDSLAKKGLQFTNFHSSPFCAPTRSMILSGNDNHVAGMGSMFSVQGTSREGKEGFEHHLTDRIVTIAQLLKEGGYQTYMAGKWHLGFENDQIPFAKGFEKSFTLLNGGANHFNNLRIFFDQAPMYRENEEVVEFPEGEYSTDVYTNKMIHYIREGQHDQPFFAYLTYTSPHWPLQVPEEELGKYKGKYDIGYDSLRVLRFHRQKAMGIIPSNAKLPPRNPSIKTWTKLTPEEKKIEAKKMEIYAAMVENLDMNIGRLFQFLKESGQLENTLIVFMSDNGAAAEDFYNMPAQFGPYLREHFDNSYENMGKASSFVSYGPQWAQAGAAPFKLHKGFTTEGGIVTPLIIAGKAMERKPGMHHLFVNVTDLAPSFLELAQLTYPEEYKGNRINPMLGESFLSFIMNKSDEIHSEDYTFGLEHDGKCMLIKGNWKITNISNPFDESAFALYNLANDRGETTDLSRSNPKKFKEMLMEWEIFKKKAGVITKQKGE